MLDSDIAVSVIMPVYNRERLIRRSIKSVLRQTRPDFELIIIDDASTDNTEATIRGYDDPRIRYIRREINHLEQYRNTGEEDNPRNDGLKIARGRYVAYLDSDDMWRTNFLEEMCKFLEARPEVDFAYSDAIWHRRLKGEEEQANCNLSLDWGPQVMKHRNIIRTLTVMHKRELVDKVGYFKPIKVRVPHEDTPYVGIEDWDYWVRISRHFKVKHLPRILSHKINETSIHYGDPDFDPEFAEQPAAEVIGSDFGLFFQAKTASEFQELTERLSEVEGYLEPAEGYALYLLAYAGYGQGRIVEIGSFLGRSTCWLALGSLRAGREKVAAVDHHLGSPEHQAGAKHKCKVLVKQGTTFHAFMENLQKLGVEEHVEPVRSESVAAAEAWSEPIRLLFIDGNHSYEASKNDFEAWSRFLVPGGYVGFHDIGTWPGVTGYYEEMLAERKDFSQRLSVGTLRIIQKTI